VYGSPAAAAQSYWSPFIGGRRSAAMTPGTALGILKDEGLIESVPGYGTFVRK